MNQREKNRIISFYNNPSYPASFSSPLKFKKSLKENSGIDVGIGELKKILQQDLAFKMSRIKPRNPVQQRVVANSVGVSAQVELLFS